MQESKKKRIIPFVGPMESWYDFLVINEHFTVDQIRTANLQPTLQCMQIPTKNLYNWNTMDDIRFIMTVYNNHSFEFLIHKFNCSEFCVWKTLKRIFGTIDLYEIRKTSRKNRKKLLHSYLEKKEKEEIAEIGEMVRELTVKK
jgi:hypothetical protein